MSTQLQYAEFSVQPPQEARLRRKCWRVVLLLDRVAAPLCGLAHSLLAEPGRPLVALRALHQTGEQLRRAHHAGHLRTHESAREAASAALADADEDDILLDHVVASLTSWQSGDPEPLSQWLDHAEIDPPLLAAYASAVQATRRALWIARHDA